MGTGEYQRRHDTFAGMVGMLSEHRLRQPPEESTDTAWAIGSIDVFLLLRSIRGWDSAHYSQWLSRTLVRKLLAPDG